MTFCILLRFSEDYSYEHCRPHPGGEKLSRVSGSKLYRILSYPNWKIAGAEFRKSRDFGYKIQEAGEFVPSAKWLEKWRKEHQPHFIYENSLPTSFGANERRRPLNDNHRVLNAAVKKYASPAKYELWYLINFSIEICVQYMKNSFYFTLTFTLFFVEESKEIRVL